MKTISSSIIHSCNRFLFLFFFLSLVRFVNAEHDHSEDDDDHSTHDDEEEDKPSTTTAWIFALASSLIVSLISLITLFFIGKQGISESLKLCFVGIGTGAMISTSAFILLPESIESSLGGLSIGALLMAGIACGIIIDLVTKFMHRSYSEDITIEVNDEQSGNKKNRVVSVVSNPALAYNNIIGDGIHNLLDGILLGIVFLHSIETGLLVTATVIIHEIPTEIGDYCILLHCGCSPRKALLMNFMSALTAVLGTLIGLLIGESSESTVAYFMPIVCGQFLFIALSQLLPELMHKRWSSSILKAILSLLLVGSLVALTLLLPESWAHSH